MQGLIVAAGQGTRLRDIAPSKPLAMLHGRPLIEHVIEQARAGGVSDFVVVTGYQAAPLEAFLRRLSMRGGFPIRIVRNADWRLANPLVDLDDVTRVRTNETGAITAIGKLIEPYDAFDTGVFLASHALVTAIREDIAACGSGGISGGMTRLAAKGHAAVHDIGEAFWLDVDDAIAYAHAERLCA